VDNVKNKFWLIASEGTIKTRNLFFTYQQISKISKIAINIKKYQKLSKIIKNYQKISKNIKAYQRDS
jgi:hypothetical protein